MRSRHPPLSFIHARWVFLRILGFALLGAFLSIASQIQGLIGPDGVLPAREYLAALAKTSGYPPPAIYAPTLLWISSGAAALWLVAGVGTLAGLALMLNVAPRAAALTGWACYLSFVAAARNFSGFQSDGLMLETLLLATVLAPGGLRPGLGLRSPPSRFAVFAMHFLLFKLCLMSGHGKLFSSDPSWRTFTAMNDYYVNCPFPSWIGWYVQHLPEIFHRASAAFTLAVEVLAVWCIWLGAPFRMSFFLMWTAMHVGIGLTGSYNTLNINSIALGVMLLDDRMLREMFGRLRPIRTARLRVRLRRRGRIHVIAERSVLGLVLYLSAAWWAMDLGARLDRIPPPLDWPVRTFYGFRSANAYGLFEAMTSERLHVEFEGSNDGGESWHTYPFRWQPQALDRRPPLIAPHLPRLDWNLWFAVLSEWRTYVLVHNTGQRLMEGEPVVLDLFAGDPFPDAPPTIMRFPLYRYHFTDLKTLRETGEWWRRERVGDYAPPLIRLPDGRIVISGALPRRPDGPQ